MLINAPLRLNDVHGSGAYGASRGSRVHKGVDIACYKGSEVLSVSDGIVTKIGYPYDPNNKKKGHLRYVQVTFGGSDFRYFYIYPTVGIGDNVKIGDALGITQGLSDIYEGITDHFHFEIKEKGVYINPMNFIV